MRLLTLTLCWIASVCAHATAWVPVGLGDGGHRYYSWTPQSGNVATHPTVGDQAVVLAGIPGGPRPFLTFDGGASWKSSPAFDNESGGPVVLSGSPTVMFLFDKALRSTDQGRSWAPVPMPAGAPNAKLRAVSPANSDEMIVTDGSRVYRTVDGARTWTMDSSPSGVALLTVDWQTKTIYAGFSRRLLDAPGTWTSWASGNSYPTLRAAARGVILEFQPIAGTFPPYSLLNKLFRSTDGGANFGEVGVGLGSPSICEIVFSSSPATRVYASECEGGGRVFRSDDDGQSWEVATNLDEAFVGSLAIDAVDPDRLFAASSRGLLYSNDGGRNFSSFLRASGVPGERRSLYFDATNSSRQWLSLKTNHERSVHRSADAGLTWLRVNLGHSLVGASQSRSNTLFGVWSEHPTGPDRRFAVSTNGGMAWSTKFDLESDMSFTQVTSLAFGQAPGLLFVASRSFDVEGPAISRIHVSTNDGDSFAERTAPPIGVRALAATTTGAARLYAAGEGGLEETLQLFESDDNALTWRWVSTLPVQRSPIDGAWPNWLNSLIVDPTDPQRLLAGFYYPDYVLRSDDGGKHWTRATVGLGVGPITSLAFDPADASVVYASQSGSGVFRSTDGGRTWVAVDDGLGDDAVFRVVPDPRVAGRIYAETYTGVYRADLGSGVPAGRRRAIEYYHANFNHYFVTAEAAEIAALDAGLFAGWVRTGEGFPVADASAAGSTPVCRYFGAGFAPISSHFYTPFASECDVLNADPKWHFETMAFGLALADAGSHGCPTGTRALRRLWNGGMSGAPNHRYTTNKWVFDTMIAEGWVFEGYGTTLVFACVPY